MIIEITQRLLLFGFELCNEYFFFLDWRQCGDVLYLKRLKDTEKVLFFFT